MRWRKTLTLVEAHAEGEVGRVVTGGVVDIPGKSMLDKMIYLNETDDSLRRFCVFEPRGCAQMSTNILLPPTRDDADVGFIVLQGDKAHSMSGSNCMCVVTVLLETGMLVMHEPQTIVKLDTPAGIVTATARCHNGKCERVSLDMIPSFVDTQDIAVTVPELGEINVDIAFGGLFYALIDAKSVGLTITKEDARRLVHHGNNILRSLKEMVNPRHPYLTDIAGVTYVMFTDHHNDSELVGATILPPGRVDRSPCGTGNSARLALRHANGQVEQGETVNAYSIIDSKFQVTLKDVLTCDGIDMVIPTISGRAWIHGIHQIGCDPDDPYPSGYLLADTWGDGFDLIN